MATLKTLRTLIGIELPTKRSECIGIVFPNIPGCNSAANKAWHIGKSVNTVTQFHTEDCPLNQKQVDGLLSFDAITDADYDTLYFKFKDVKVWVEDEVICN